MKIRTAMMASLVIFAAGSARAVTFTFDDEYLLNGGANFSTVFPGVSGIAPLTGLYQETATGTTPVITRLVLGATYAVPGEFIQNTTPGLSQALELNGWGQSLNYGQKVDTVFNTGYAPYFRYDTGIVYGNIPGGGAPTKFNFNSADFRGRGQVTLVGYLGSSQVDSSTVTLTSSFQTFTENWANVDTVRICNGAGTPSCQPLLSFNQIGMDNVRINEPLAPVPEPATWGMMLVGMLGIGGLLRNQRKARGLRTATA